MKLAQYVRAFLVALGTSSVVLATPISGEIHFSGSATLTGGTGTYATATGIDFWNPIDVTEVISTGAYAGLAAGTTATFTDFTFGVVGTTGPNAQTPLWTFTDGTLTYSFDLTNLTLNAVSGTARVLEGGGWATITGGSSTYTATPGFWQLSTSGTRTDVSFSSFTDVPEGGTTALLVGVALVGLGLSRRRKVTA